MKKQIVRAYVDGADHSWGYTISFKDGHLEVADGFTGEYQAQDAMQLELEAVGNNCDCKKCREVRAEVREEEDDCPYDEGTDSQAEWVDGICEPMFEIVKGSYKLDDCGMDYDTRHRVTRIL
jgi:hypothetical protein